MSGTILCIPQYQNLSNKACSIPKCNLGTGVDGMGVNISPPINAFEMCSYKDRCFICLHSMPSSSDYVMLCLRFYNQDTPNFSAELLSGSNILNENI